MSDAIVPYQDIQAMAKAVVASRLFPQVQSEQAAIALMLLCQAEGIHPMMALRRYDLIQGRPAMKTDAMLAEFQKRGGKVRWIRLDDECAEAEFMSAGLMAPVKIKFDSSDAKRAGLLGKDNWNKYPRAMRRARVISEGVRTADPGVNAGVYSPEEVSDFDVPTPPAQQGEPADLSPALEESIRLAKEAKARSAAAVAEFAPDKFDAKNAASLPLGEFEAPPVCTRDGCSGAVARYQSESKQFPGRWYWQCEAAHNEKLQILEEGGSNKTANAAVSGHYRNWAEPWPRGEAVETIGVATAPPARLTPDVFEQIEKDTAAKIAKEG